MSQKGKKSIVGCELATKNWINCKPNQQGKIKAEWN